MRHRIGKQFDFCYGHRVWSQELNSEFSLDSCLKCRHLHGHQGKVIIFLKDDKLNNGMVTDFKHLNWFKKFLDDVLDHKFIMDVDDPLLFHEVPIIKGLDRADAFTRHSEGYYVIADECYRGEPQAVREKYEGMVFVEFVPTSENLSKWFFDIVKRKMSEIDVIVDSVVLFETPKSQAIYESSY